MDGHCKEQKTMSGKQPMKKDIDYDAPDFVSTYLADFWGLGPSLFAVKEYITDLHKIFSEEIPPGNRQLDFGSGPSLNCLISSSRYCDDVVCAEYAAVNRRELEKLVAGDREIVYDWKDVMKFVADLEGKSGEQIEKRVKSSIRKIVPCNVHEEDLSLSLFTGPYDVITTCLCLEAACPNIESYHRTIMKLSEYIKPGGVFVILGVLNQADYTVGDETFFSLSISEEQIEYSLRQAGFDQPKWYKHTDMPVEGVFYGDAYFSLSTRKL